MSNLNNYEEFEALLNEYMPVRENDEPKKKVTGTIVTMDRTFAYLEIPGEPKSVRVRSEELIDKSLGDEIEVIIITEAEEDDDLILIGSKRRVDMEIGSEKLKLAFQNHDVVTGHVTKKVNGGYIINIFSQQGFLPNSLSEISAEQAENLVGTDIDVVVKEIKEDRRGKKILLSRKEIVIAKELEAIDKLKLNEVLDVTVLAVLDFGLTVKLGDVKGFIHISEIDWKKTTNLHALYKVGDIVKAQIIEINKEKRNIKLSIKNLIKNPWETLAENHKIGTEAQGKVTRITSFGAFVEILPGVEGLIHSSDFSWNNKKVNVSNFVKVGDEIKVVITDLNPQERKLKLGIKQLSENPWANAQEKFAVGTIATGTVVEVKPFGIFVQLEEGVDGFIHNSDFAWFGNRRYSKADKVEFKITELNAEAQKIKGSIKDLTKNPWDSAMEKYKVGDKIERPIKNIQDFGVFVNLEEGVDGFIPTQLTSKHFIKSPKDKFHVGETVLAEIIEIDSEKKRIKLSIKKIELEDEKNENKELIEKYGVSSSEK